MDNSPHPKEQQLLASYRDIFLSHRSFDKDFVRMLAGDIEATAFQDRSLLTWVDEAEIGPGQSVTGMVNEGLERSRFIGLVMTPAYFEKRESSGWTDAEWHAALFGDPDNRRASIIPLLVADCPYMPFLLRHLKYIDFRKNRYNQALKELLRILRDEPLPRPVAHRGQLITPGRQIDRLTLVTERATLEADPDVISENLYCNLLPVDRLPKYVYVAKISTALCNTNRDGTQTLPSKQKVKDAIALAQQDVGKGFPFVPAFRLYEDSIVTFHDLEAPDNPFGSVIDDKSVDKFPTEELVQDEGERNLLISLLNMTVGRHAHQIGLVIDDVKRERFFFPPKDGGIHSITWIPKLKKATREVAKPYIKDNQVLFWRHYGVYLKIVFLANNFYLKITPTWVITEDGIHVRRGPKVGRVVIRWTGAERNLAVLYHIRFWTTVLRAGPGPIVMKAGDQLLEISQSPAFVQQSYGIADDQRDLLGLLDVEAPMIAKEEERLVNLEAIFEVTQEEEDDEDEDLVVDDIEEELEFDVE